MLKHIEIINKNHRCVTSIRVLRGKIQTLTLFLSKIQTNFDWAFTFNLNNKESCLLELPKKNIYKKTSALLMGDA